MLQTKLPHPTNKTPARCKQKNYILQTKANVLRAQDDVKDWDLVSWFLWFMAEFLRREIRTGVTKTQTTKTQTPQIFSLKKGLVNPSQFLSPNILWSCNVHQQQPERSKIFIFSGLSPSKSNLLTLSSPRST